MTIPEFGEPVAESLAWRLIAELARRHPDRLWVHTETHSIGSEQAFFVDLKSPANPPLGFFGLPGSAAERWAASDRMEWRDAYDGFRDPREWLLEFESMVGLDSPESGLGASTSSSLALRFVGQFLVATLGSRQHWIAGSAGRWHGRANLIPPDVAWPHRNARPHPVEAIYIGERGADQPVAALAPSGDVWTAAGGHFDLESEYKRAGSVTGMVLNVMHAWMS